MSRSLFSRLARLALPTITLLLAPVAHAQIFQPGTQPVGHPDGLVEPIQSAVVCERCHARYDAEDDYEPVDSWRGAMMANAGRDPVALAAIAIAEEDHPDAADFCIRCHSPIAWLNGRSELPEWSMADGPRLAEDSDTRLSADRDGVVCMTCHRSLDPRPEIPLQNAQLVLLDGEDAQVRLGPYEYAPGEDPQHPTRRDDFISSSELCGQCHDISNPVLMGRRADGSSTGRPFAIERTYSEWRFSEWGDGDGTEDRTCIDCHLPEVDHPVPAASGSGFTGARAEMSRHDLVGGSTWQVATILASLPEAVRMRWEASYTGTIARARTMLEGSARVDIMTSGVEGERARATIRVTNLSGHKLPTGYPEGRRMWLEVEVLDSTGAVVSGSARFDPVSGEVEEDAQARLYQVKLGQTGESGAEPSFHFVLNDVVLEDTRIPPAGFVPPEDRDMAPIGRDYADGMGGYRNYDEQSYDLVACGSGELTLRARLRYQSTTREYIEFLRDHAPDSADPALMGESWGDVAYRGWMTHGGSEPVDVATVTASLGASPRACPVEMDAGMEVDAGAAVDAGSAPPPASGCSCRVGAAPSPTPALLSLGALAAVLLSRRRRR